MSSERINAQMSDTAHGLRPDRFHARQAAAASPLQTPATEISDQINDFAGNRGS
jgi:hypothetical protein